MTKKLVVVLAAVLIFVAAFILKESQTQTSGAETASVAAQTETLPRLVDLGSDKCIPCKKMAPILEALAEEYRGSLVVEVLDVRKNPELGRKWSIRVIPTQIFMDSSGAERYRHEGFMAKEAILAKWSDLGIELARHPEAPGT